MSDRSRSKVQRDFVLQRFFALSLQDQLAVFGELREYLGAGDGPRSSLDQKLLEQAAALDAMGAVARDLGLPPGRSPNTVQFNEVAPRVAPGWNVSRVVRLFKKWHLAAEIYEGKQPSRTAAQLGVERRAGRRRRREDYIVAVRKWLDSRPEAVFENAYNDFTKIYNEHLEPGELPLPIMETMRKALKLNFREIVRVARGEVDLENAQPYEPRMRHRLADKEGPHGLIGGRTAAELCGSPTRGSGHLVYRPGFPEPALVVDRQRLWRREDVEAFAAGRPVPDRPFNELRGLYVTLKDLAEITGVVEGRVSGIPGAPEPAVVISNKRIYLRDDVEAALPAIREHRAVYARYGPKGKRRANS